MKGIKKRNKIMVLLILLLAISVGYALLSTTLKINGSSTIKKNNWNIHWDNPVNKVAGGEAQVVKAAQLKTVNETVDNTTVEFEVTLNEPGDYYEFEVDAVNEGTLDAMVTEISSTVNGEDISTLPSYIKYSITYADGNPVRKYHLLEKAPGLTEFTRERYKVRVEFLKSITEDQLKTITADTTYVFNYSVKYGQADEYAYTRNFSDLEFYVLPDNSTDVYKGTVISASDTTDDYTTLGRKTFFGLKLDSDRKVTNAYACGVINNEVYCLEGKPTNEIQPITEARMTAIFGEWSDTTKVGCKDVGAFLCFVVPTDTDSNPVLQSTVGYNAFAELDGTGVYVDPHSPTNVFRLRIQ